MKPDDVHYIAVEGGGVGGMLIHPGALEALETLWVARREQFKPAGILSWSGSSSGSIVSALVSSGYASWEIASLVSQEAFDMVFRLENIQQGEFAAMATIADGCKRHLAVQAAADLGLMAIIANALVDPDPAGAFLDQCHKIRLLISSVILETPVVYILFRTWQMDRLDAILRDSRDKGTKRFESLAEEAKRDVDRRMKKWPGPPPPQHVYKLLEAEFPHLVSRLLSLIIAHAAGMVKGPSIFQILKQDFGLASGCVWRDYIDHLIAFARFRVRFAAYLPSLALPRVEDMKSVSTLDELFHAAIERAIAADYDVNESPPYEFCREYDCRRHCTFAKHAAEFYDWRGPVTVPPLIISGANIVTQESHLFSALATPDFQVADAVRIATGFPFVFKPVLIEAADIPSNWPVKTDRFGSGHYLEGLWVDGGLYYNAPFEVFKEASSSFIGEGNTMGLGAGIQERANMDNLTQFLMAFINMGYEANVSVTRLDLENYLNINKFGVGFYQPKLIPKVLEYCRLDAYWRTFQFFGLDPGF